jgi:hypothetical protein
MIVLLATPAARQRALLSVPTRCRSTPIATKGLRVMVRVDPEGTVNVRLAAWARDRAKDSWRSLLRLPSRPRPSLHRRPSAMDRYQDKQPRTSEEPTAQDVRRPMLSDIDARDADRQG